MDPIAEKKESEQLQNTTFPSLQEVERK